MKKCLVLLVIFSVVLSGCTAVQKATQNIETKPKPTKQGALEFGKKYWKLMDEKKYADAYELLSPENKKMVSKDAFLKRLREQDEQNKNIIINPEVIDAEVSGDAAKLTIILKNPMGDVTETDNIVFVDGKWYQQLENDSLISYGVDPVKIPGIEKASLGQAFSIPGFDAVVNQAIADKISTGEFGTRDTAQGKFVITTITVTNTGKEAFRFMPDDYLKLLDSEQRSFNPSTEPSFSFGDEIGPGMNAALKIGFDVPENAKGFKLLVGSGNDQYLIDLGF